MNLRSVLEKLYNEKKFICPYTDEECYEFLKSEDGQNQVDAAINQQEGVLQIAEQELSKAMQTWTVLHQKRKGMADLIEGYKQQEMSVLDKKEQQQIESDLLSRRVRNQ